MNRLRSEQLYAEACERMPGGVNSPVRAFRGVGGTPIFFESAEGAYMVDVDGNRYIDYVGSWGPMILGHAHPPVIKAVQDAAARGTSFGAPTAIETEMAVQVISMVPSIEMIRFVSSGTEATMSAIRLARGFTGRSKLVKFDGCYHGHGDSLLVSAGSGVATLGIPGTAGVLTGTAEQTLTIPYNDADALSGVFAAFADDIAAVIVEPVAGNMGCVPPREGFLEQMRALCTEHGVVLIFDEVMTGFRVALGGAQAHYGVKPDLTTLGKIVGGGLPVGAYGGRRDIMDHVAPVGGVYQAGTLSGNPLAMAAGLTTLQILAADPTIYDKLTSLTARLLGGLIDAGRTAGVPVSGHQVGAMFGLYFREEPVWSQADAKAADSARFAKFFHAMLDRGVYLAPSAFEAGFMSTAHTEADIDATVVAATEAFATL